MDWCNLHVMTGQRVTLLANVQVESKLQIQSNDQWQCANEATAWRISKEEP